MKVSVCSLGLLAVGSLFAYVGRRPPPQTCFVTLLLSHSFFCAAQNLTLSRGMVLADIFSNKFKRVNATTRTVFLKALKISIPDIILTVSWFVWGVANGSISIHRSGFGCGHPNGQFLTTAAVIYRCSCVVAMLYYWKQLREFKHTVAERTRGTLKSLAVAYYLTVAGLVVVALAPVDMARYSAYIIIFSSTLGLSLVSMFGANLAVAIWPVDSNELVEVPSDILIATSTSTLQDTAAAVHVAVTACKKQLSGRSPDLIVLSYTEQHEPRLLRAAIQRSFPQTPIVGASTCMGVLHQADFASQDGCSLGLWMVCDPEGVYAVSHCAYQSTSDEKQGSERLHMQAQTEAHIAGQQCINRALVAATSRKVNGERSSACSGGGDINELPPFIWMASYPGHEEELIAGMTAAFGRPGGEELSIIGGSAADNKVQNRWSVMSSTTRSGEGDNQAIIAVCWPSVFVKVSMFSAYSPQARNAQVTKAHGRRILEIKGQPAAEVLNEWSANSYKGAITRLQSGQPTNILSLSAMNPLGIHKGYDFEEEPWYQNIHPNDIGPDGSVGCFAQVNEGEQLVQMSTTKDALVRRVGVAAKHIVRDSHFSLAEIKGSLAVYCGGCMLAIQDSMDSTSRNLAAALGNAPFMGVCSFGEQGPGPDGHPVHANLMFSTVVISNKRRIPKFSNNASLTHTGSMHQAAAGVASGSRRSSCSVNVNVSPHSALAHFQGPTADPGSRRGSLNRFASTAKMSKVHPSGVSVTQVPTSDTQFGDSVLYGMEDDIPVSPLSHSSSMGLQTARSSQHSGNSRDLDSTEARVASPISRSQSEVQKAAPVGRRQQPMLKSSVRQDDPAAAVADRQLLQEARIPRVSSRGRSLRRIASASDLTRETSVKAPDEQ